MRAVSSTKGLTVEELQNHIVDIHSFLSFSAQLTSAVAELHSQGEIHGKLSPRDILFHPETGHVTFQEIHSPHKASTTEAGIGKCVQPGGDPAYMSPEQMRRHNHRVDYRTDLYTIGIIMYEVLTGQHPFIATDPLEWAHSHLAYMPPPPPSEVKKDIPVLVSDIIMKLLSKDTDNRYQTALGLKADLASCLHLWLEHGHIHHFILGQSDISDQLFIPQKLYGRQREIKKLQNSFRRVMMSGHPELVLVAGYSGIGKTSLIRELHNPVIRRNGFFSWGKFDQYKRNIPYATIVDAFKEIIGQILMKAEEELTEWRIDLWDALGINGQLIIDILPQLEHVIGKQQPVAELPLGEAENRFKMVFRQFINVFAQKDHPLVLFFDDLQWADSASLGLIEYLLEDPGPCYLMLLGAYRDNEVDSSHPLYIQIEAIHQKELTVHQLTLEPLSLAHLQSLLADTFHLEHIDVQSLAQLVHEKTGGNAFFTTQFLHTLHGEKLIEVDKRTHKWCWNIDGIKAKGYADNIVDLMMGNLKRLSQDAQHILTVAACIGNTFDLQTVAAITEIPEVEIETILGEPLQMELVFFDLPGNSFSFLHDRVHQSAYSLIPQGQAATIHLEIGRHLAKVTSSDEIEESPFDIVNQFNLGQKMIMDRDESYLAAELNLIAGRKAGKASAYQLCLNYLLLGFEFVDGKGWEDHYYFMYELFKELAIAQYVNSNYTESTKLTNTVLERARSNLERAELYNVLIIQHTLLGQYDKAIIPM